MYRKQKIRSRLLPKIISVLVMCACLLFLTGVNFFLFPQGRCTVSLIKEDNKELPQSPAEEKHSEHKSPSVQEEYLHEHTAIELSCFNRLSLHKIHRSDNLQMVHYDIVSPPPKS